MNANKEVLQRLDFEYDTAINEKQEKIEELKKEIDLLKLKKKQYHEDLK